MGRMGRPELSLEQKSELWDRWSSGQSLSKIGRALGKHSGSIHGVLAAKGGIVLPERMRAVRFLGDRPLGLTLVVTPESYPQSFRRMEPAHRIRSPTAQPISFAKPRAIHSLVSGTSEAKRPWKLKVWMDWGEFSSILTLNPSSPGVSGQRWWRVGQLNLKPCSIPVIAKLVLAIQSGT